MPVSTMFELTEDPMKLFDLWYQEALKIPCREPTSMVLATSNKKGIPSARVVLLKKYSSKGFVFFTNINSRKGQELTENPYAALVFHWMNLSKQIRVEGVIELLNSQECDEYFASRSRDSQIGAWCSQQSQVLPCWQSFIDQIESTKKQFANKPIKRPEYWVGITVIPNTIEFWQEGANRIHTRHRYSRTSTSNFNWIIEQLYP